MLITVCRKRLRIRLLCRFLTVQIIKDLFKAAGNDGCDQFVSVIIRMKVVRQASRHVDLIEERLLSNHVQRNRADLARLRRMLLRFQRLLAPEPAAMFRLLNRPPAWMDRAVVQAFRQFTEEFSVVLNDLSGLIERISLLQEEIGARQLEQSNRTLYTLTVITVLALPINIVAGFFGMNVGGIPLASNHHGFILLVVIVAVFTLGAGYLAFRRRDDL